MNRTLPAAPVTAAPAELRHVLACVTILLMPFPLILRGFGNPALSYDYNTIIFPVDVAFLALIVTGAGALVRRLVDRRAGLGTATWTLFAVVMSLAWFAHPSTRGAHVVFELWGCAVLAEIITDALDGMARPLVLGAIAIVACGETVWSALQLILKSNLGLHRLGEDRNPLFAFSARGLAPMGSMVHIYVLCGLALVGGGVLVLTGLTARGSRLWLLGAAIAAVPVGYTYSRAGLLGAALLVGGVGLGLFSRTDPAGRRKFALAVLALTVGIGLPAAIWHEGWTNRVTQTTTATTAAQLTTQRGTLTHEALSQIGANPVFGIGPGRYVISLKERFHHEADKTVEIFKPVHDVPLLVAAEGGVVAGAVLVALLALVGWRAARSRPAAFGLYAAYLPFLLLDHFPYSFPQGLVITAIWLGALDASWPGRRTRPGPGQMTDPQAGAPSLTSTRIVTNGDGQDLSSR